MKSTCHLLLFLLISIAIPTGHCSATSPKKKPFVLVIDPGHGGHDSGAVGKSTKEKNINLAVALEFGRLVKKECPGVKVVYTRSKDVFVPLQRRADIANRAEANLFISIHTNALPKGKIAYGAETYSLGMAATDANLEVAKRENSVITYEEGYRTTYEGFDPNRAESYIIFELMQDRYMKQSVELARCIQQQYVKHAGRRNKGVHQAGFLVLRKTSMPSVLTELGFISTPAEERYLSSKAGTEAMARSLLLGFKRYCSLHVRNAEGRVVVSEQPIPAADNDADNETRQTQDAPEEKKGHQEAEDCTPKTQNHNEQPIFKLQLLVSDRKLRTGDRRLKGVKNTDFYQEKGMLKYTCGASTNYNEILRLQRSLKSKFPDAFIVAFEGGKRVELAPAVRKWRANK